MVRKILVTDAVYLDEYLVENRFDLYYQSPWTAGFHMCEILHYSIDAGLRLFNGSGSHYLLLELSYPSHWLD